MLGYGAKCMLIYHMAAGAEHIHRLFLLGQMEVIAFSYKQGCNTSRGAPNPWDQPPSFTPSPIINFFVPEAIVPLSRISASFS